MIPIFPLLFAILANATCTRWSDVWEVLRNDTVDEAARILGLPDYRAIQERNPGINTAFIAPGQTYDVPFTTPIAPPGTWVTTGCSHILYLRGQSDPTHRNTDVSTETSESSVCPSTTTESSNRRSTSSTRTYSPTHSSSQSSQPASRTDAPRLISACHPSGKFPKIKDTQSDFATRFCSHHENSTLNSNSHMIVDLFDADGQGHFHLYSVGWIPSCQLKSSQTVKGPPQMRCGFAMKTAAFEACDNGGMGGFVDIDCLRYDYRPLSPVKY